MTRIDFAGSKLWLLTSVIAISGIRLLDVYINVSGHSDRELLWSAIIYAVFVASAVALALVDVLRAGHAAVSKHEDAAKIQLSSCPGPQRACAASKRACSSASSICRRFSASSRPRA